MTSVLSIGLLGAALWFLSEGLPQARAHGELHTLIQAATQDIEKHPRDPILYLKRAELHRAHLGWDLAMADIEYASGLSNQWPHLHYARAGLYLDAGWYESAVVSAGRFLVHQPNHEATLVIRARALEKLGRHLAAAADYTRAIDYAPAPGPQLYLERAQALKNAGAEHLDQALRGLEEGLQRLGTVVTLQLAAIELELEQQRVDAALARMDSIQALSPRKERWLARRGEILDQAGRHEEAAMAYRKALELMQTLPVYRRRVPAMLQLEKQIQAALSR